MTKVVDMLPRSAYSLSRNRVIAVIAAATAVAGAVLFAGTAGASTGSIGPSLIISPTATTSDSIASLAPTTSSATVSDSPSPSDTSTATVSPSPSDTSTATATSSPTADVLVLDGVAKDGPAPGCILMKTYTHHTYQLLVPSTMTIPLGIPIEVDATLAIDSASYCMQGTLVDVLDYSLL